MTNNTELFERILEEKLDEVAITSVHGVTWAVMAPHINSRAAIEYYHKASVLAGGVISEFYRWVCGGRYGYAFGRYWELTDESSVNTKKPSYTELELFDIWKAEKGGEG